MKLHHTKDPETLENCFILEIEYEEVARAFSNMDRVWRELLDQYAGEDSTISEKLFFLSEVAKQIEDERS